MKLIQSAFSRDILKLDAADLERLQAEGRLEAGGLVVEYRQRPIRSLKNALPDFMRKLEQSGKIPPGSAIDEDYQSLKLAFEHHHWPEDE